MFIRRLRPASFDGGGSSTGGTKLAYIRVGRSKHDEVREVRRASTVESLMHDSSNFEGDTVPSHCCGTARKLAGVSAVCHRHIDIWYSEEGPERAGAPPSPLIAVPN